MKNFGKKRNKEQWKSGSTTRFLIAVLFGVQLLYALNVSGQQAVTVSGTVTDIQGQPLPGATVVEEGTTNGAVTNADGVYMIAVPGNATLVFSFVGMKTQQVAVNSRTKIDIKFEEESIGLDEVVAIGYGTQSRRTLTTSVAKVDGETLENIPISNIGEGLKGKISGARVYSNNTAPGADPVIRIRGGSSINKSNAPLILIDGVELNLSDINPNDIESIEVLKDAASTAIYGSRASNGVILVTTKRGSVNKAPRVTFEATWARQEYERFYDFMNAEDYISMVRPAVVNSPYPNRNFISGYSASSGNDETSIYTTRYLEPGESVPEGWESMTDPIDPTKTLTFQNNPQRNILFNPALWQNYFVGIDGGTDALRYTGSIGYTNDKGIALGTGWERFSGRTNVDANISEKLHLGTNFSFTQSITEEYYNQMNVIARGLSTAPTHRVYWEDGTPAPGWNNTAPPPLWNEYTRNDSQKEQRLTMGSLLDWNIIDRLHAKVSGSYYVRTWQRDYFMKAHKFDGSRPAETYFSQDTQSKLEAYFTYDKSFNHHSISGVAGYSYLSMNFKDVSAAAMGANTDKIQTLNAAPIKTEATSEIHEEALIGYFGRLSYDYKKKYLISATFRRDGSSRFLSGNQWGFFPGVSLGWIISEESFMKNIEDIRNLKFRLSYGQTGNNQVGRYDAQGRYSVETKYDGNAGMRSVDMPNANLTWETSNQLDVGFDLGLFNNRINVIADYFDKRTQNLIFSKPLPNTSGFSNVDTNIGKVKFYGFDTEISTINISKKDFEWTSKLTWSYVKNLVLELPDNGRYKNRIGGIVLDPDDPSKDYGGIAEGEPLYRYYGYVVDYIIQTQEQADNALYDANSNGFSPVDKKRIKGRKLPGDYEWVDRNGDKIIDSKDQFELGVTVPHTTGGLANNFRYKNWALNVYLDWAIGHSINDNSYMRFFMNTLAYNYALVEQAKDTWSSTNTNATHARFTANDPDDGSRNFARTSSAFNFKADYLCIREITLNYNIPPNIYSALGIYNANIYISGNNLHYFTSLIGTSPEEGAETTYSSDYYNYPAVRKFSVGIKVTF
jgi:TonB-linked SusC/RagA family outer membrane protein